MHPNLVVYNAILFNRRVAAYKLNSEYWYVYEWGKKAYLHVTEKRKNNSVEFYWYLADSTLWPQWRCQTEVFKITDTVTKEQKITLEDLDILETERQIRDNPGCDIY